jgi:23S rRNA (adenine2503-C2)-methyltransferase
MKNEATKIQLLGCDQNELDELVVQAGQPEYRGRQLFEAVYRQRLATVDEISTLPAELRRQFVSQGIGVGMPKIVNRFTSVDGTVRYLIGFEDGASVETVWMPEGDGGESGDGSEAGDESPASSRGWSRATICVSSQVGCAVDCQFCLTAALGVKRNLQAGEIVGQICAVLKDQVVKPPQERVNIVFMGMGEPFLNYDAFMKAARLAVQGVGIPESRMTVSTAGIVPRIHQLGQENIRPKLAISLNASNDTLRSRLMPINRKWNLERLMHAAREFPLRSREKLTFEYVLLNGVNDSAENAREVAALIRGMQAKVNLIALNPGPGIDFKTPDSSRVEDFQRILIRAAIPAFVRRPRGRDIFAACGQLKRTVELTTIGAAGTTNNHLEADAPDAR